MEIFRLSTFLLIFIRNIKSEFFFVCKFKPYPSEPKSKTLFPSQLCLEKSLLEFPSKPLTQKFLDLRYFKAVFIFETSKIFTNSMQPLELLYNNLLSLGKDLSLTIIPSILKDAALLIIEPIFLGSVTSSKATKLIFFLLSFFSIKSLKFFFPDVQFLQQNLDVLFVLLYNIYQALF